ncbi:MAG: alanine--tRNA ligase [Parachlamydiales bacterium]|jgi:alanyl-tRNA synthetase
MLTQSIRRQFIEYFKSKGHAHVISSSVVPHEDPTLLFSNAGMNQFKEVFLGMSVRDYKRATTCQKCIRAGGKHNDLDNVGHTSRHLTFFEMLGNFSFGDYFKKEAMAFAWEVATKVFGFDEDKIWPTVFREDDEAFELWKQYVPVERITRMDEKDNFWAMGDTGPCGPCSELYYDRGPAFGKGTSPADDPDGERYIEFWNLVFMQYNRQPDGKLVPLPNPSIDTGAGLERVVSLKMNVNSIFLTDIFQGIIQKIEEISGKKYVHEDEKTAPAFRVIADHLRSLSFAIADGAQPSNVERGYVLRKILRRAVRYGRQLGIDEPFLGRVLPRLIELMGEDYPELRKAEKRISDILTGEEEAFLRTLQRGGNMLNQVIQRAQEHNRLINGEDAFKLKDTYGLPIEEILLFAKDNNFTVELRRYEELENEARERSRSQHKTAKQSVEQSVFAEFAAKEKETEFLGYENSTATAVVKALIKEGAFVKRLEKGEEGMVILDKTPFYAEMGGQVGDSGMITTSSGRFEVKDAQAPSKGITGHIGIVQDGLLQLGDTVEVSLDTSRRQQIANNHTATHLLHWALHKVLGEHVKQAGSVVDEGHLRFDFNHHKALTADEIEAIENLVNDKIRQNNPVKWYEIPYDQAQHRQDIKQFFGDKYGTTVRVVDIDYSKELCGGTHTSFTGNIGLFIIPKESSIAAGVRRIEAITGAAAMEYLRSHGQQIEQLAALAKVKPLQLQDRLNKLLDENKALSQELKKLRQGSLSQKINEMLSEVSNVNNIPLIAAELAISADELRQCADETMARLGSGVLVLGNKENERCQLLIRVSDDLVGKGVNAQAIIKEIAPIVGGSGGGKPNNAQAGGKDPSKLGEAFAAAKQFLARH